MYVLKKNSFISYYWWQATESIATLNSFEVVFNVLYTAVTVLSLVFAKVDLEWIYRWTFEGDNFFFQEIESKLNSFSLFKPNKKVFDLLHKIHDLKLIHFTFGQKRKHCKSIYICTVYSIPYWTIECPKRYPRMYKSK